MTIQDLGSLGELVAAIATVATLLYLAVQVRQNSRLIQDSTYHASNQWNLTALSAIATSAETAATFRKGLAGRQPLEPAEQTQFAVLMALLFGGFQQQYESHRAGILEDAQWEKIERLVGWYLEHDGVAAWWAEGQQALTPEFVSFAEQARQEASAPRSS